MDGPHSGVSASLRVASKGPEVPTCSGEKVQWGSGGLWATDPGALPVKDTSLWNQGPRCDLWVQHPRKPGGPVRKGNQMGVKDIGPNALGPLPLRGLTNVDASLSDWRGKGRRETPWKVRLSQTLPSEQHNVNLERQRYFKFAL